jgi:hypothetical protein
MWRAKTFISTPSTDRARSRVPTLVAKDVEGNEVTATSNVEKTELFKAEFFLIAPKCAQIDETEYKKTNTQHQNLTSILSLMNRSRALSPSLNCIRH